MNKIEVFEYTPKGRFVGGYESLSACLRANKVRKSNSLYFKEALGFKYGVLPNGNFVVYEKIGRNNIIKINKVHTSPYCSNHIKMDNKVVQVYNLENVLLLEARNINVLSKLTGISVTTIWGQLNSKRLKFILPKNDLIFKYLETEK